MWPYSMRAPSMGDSEGIERKEHADVMAHLLELENQHRVLSRELGDTKTHTEHHIDALRDQVQELCVWTQIDAVKSAWLYESEQELRQIVEGARWVKMTQKLIAWVVGAITGTIMALSAVEVFLREHLK